MNNQTLPRILNRFSLLLFVALTSFVAGCSDDPESANEEEVITTVMVTLTPQAGAEGADVVTLSWDDANLNAIVDASEVTTSGPLLTGQSYDASIQILNKSVSPEIDITEEIREEAEEHIFCFEITQVGISITNPDEDDYGLPVGLTSTWTTPSVAGTGTVNITLRHQPGVKTGDCPGAGETDASITFQVEVIAPEA